MEKSLKEIKEKYSTIASAWNGEDRKGEDEALSAQDILDKIESIEQEKADWRRIGNDITLGLDKLEEMVKKHESNY